MLEYLIDHLVQIEWQRESIHYEIKQTVSSHNLKFPSLAMPVRVMVTGEAQTPAIDAVLELLGKEETLRRLRSRMEIFPR